MLEIFKELFQAPTSTDLIEAADLPLIQELSRSSNIRTKVVKKEGQEYHIDEIDDDGRPFRVYTRVPYGKVLVDFFSPDKNPISVQNLFTKVRQLEPDST